jgi:hypothetical protein
MHRAVHLKWIIDIIPATWEAVIQKIVVQDQPGQKVSKHQTNQAWWHVPMISAEGEAICRRTAV